MSQLNDLRMNRCGICVNMYTFRVVHVLSSAVIITLSNQTNRGCDETAYRTKLHTFQKTLLCHEE